MKKINWPQIRLKLREAVLVLPHFCKNPVAGMQNLPHWDWPTILILQGAFAAGCSVVTNILERDLLGVVFGLVLAPLAIYLVTAIGSAIFLYTFLFWFQRELPFQRIYLHLVFAAIPTQIVAIISGMIPPVLLIGAAASLLLLFVGFNHNFQLERPKLKKLLVGLMALYFAFWMVHILRVSSRQELRRLKATPESLDILEKELSP